MGYVLIGALALGGLLGLGQVLVRTDPRLLVRFLRYLLGGILIVVGIAFTVGGRFALGIPALIFGAGAIFTGRIGPLDFGVGTRSAGKASTVRARFVEATLDHDSGTLKGTVLDGAFAGKTLDDLSEAELRELRNEVAGDADSVALVEAYLDRRVPGWREDAEDDRATGTGRPTDSGAMTDEEAYQILGLPAGASEAEIRAAYHRLMKGVHPDRGGSSFLAARINQAKDRLLGKHR